MTANRWHGINTDLPAMRLLYFTRGHTDHDRRFLRAFSDHGVEVGYLALRDAATAIDQLQMPAGVKALGNLDRKSVV